MNMKYNYLNNEDRWWTYKGVAVSYNTLPDTWIYDQIVCPFESDFPDNFANRRGKFSAYRPILICCDGKRKKAENFQQN